MPRPKIEDAKPRLMASGLSLFAKLGTERVNSNAIARRAKVGIGTFYSHFEDKYALLQEIQIRTLAELRDARLTAVRGAAATPEAQVAAVIRAVLEFAERHPEAYRVSLGRERAGDTKHRPVVSESSRPTAQVLRQMQLQGRIDPHLDVDLAARAYAACEVGSVLWWLEDRLRVPLPELVDTLWRLHPAIACRTER